MWLELNTATPGQDTGTSGANQISTGASAPLALPLDLPLGQNIVRPFKQKILSSKILRIML